MSLQRDAIVSRLNELYDDYWEHTLRENPTWATYLGDHRYDDRLEDASAEAYHLHIDKLRGFLEELRTLKRPRINADRLNYDLFRRELALQIEGAKYDPHLLPITQQSGPHIDLPQITTYHPFKTLEDYENYISRLRQFPTIFEQITLNLKTGINNRILQPRIVVEKIIPQLDVQVVSTANKSELSKPVEQIPSSLTEEEARRISSEIEEAVTESVVPSYAKLLKFMKETYLPRSRVHPGIWALPKGRAMYAYNIRYFTTTKMTPLQIHRIGKRELGRIGRETRALLRKSRFKGTVQGFNDKLRADRSNFYTTRLELLNGFREILRKMGERLPLLFGRLPIANYELREIEDFRADSAPAAYYYVAPEDRSRPAYFYVNTYKPETRPKYTMEALAYHEAVPGHHLQLAVQQELTNLPKFRRHGGFTAFIEGWALYAERIAKEIGFYRDLLSDFGRLTQEAWRAARLVIDTGIHSMKWTRDQAIRFLKENTALPDQDVVSEVDRYISWPGQALAYKIGELKIRQLRSAAEKRLKKRFDLRKFHDYLLNDGALPLDLFEKKMRSWSTAS